MIFSLPQPRPRKVTAWLALIALATSHLTASHLSIAQVVKDPQVLEEIVVMGKRQGPPLWRISNGEHQLWLFGLVEPLPKSLDWDDRSVAAIIGGSSRYLAPPALSASIGNPFKAIGVLRRYAKLKKLPKRQRLAQVLPAQMYQQLTGLAQQLRRPVKRYQKLRPLFVAQAISERAWDQAELETSAKIERQILKIAKRKGVQVIEHIEEIDVDAALSMLNNIKWETELKCLQVTMDALGSDTVAAKKRAMAWADGDASSLVKMDYPKVRAACNAFLYSNPMANQAIQRARQQWLTSATEALNEHQSSFASLPIAALVEPQGVLDELRSRGFTVRGQ